MQAASAGDLAGDAEGLVRPAGADVVHAHTVQIELTQQGVINRAAADRAGKGAARSQTVQRDDVIISRGSRSAEQIELRPGRHVDGCVRKDRARANRALNHECARIHVDRAGCRRTRPSEGNIAQTGLGEAEGAIDQHLAVSQIASVVVVEFQRPRATQGDRRGEAGRVGQLERPLVHRRGPGVGDDIGAALGIDAGQGERARTRLGQRQDAGLVAHAAIEGGINAGRIDGQRAGDRAAGFKVLDDSIDAGVGTETPHRLVESVELEFGVLAGVVEVQHHAGRHLIARAQRQGGLVV